MEQAYHETAQDNTAAEPIGEERWAHFEDACLAKGFTQIPNVVMRNADLSMQARCLYGLLLSYAWQEGLCFPGLAALARDAGVSERSVRGYVRELERAGLLKVRRRGLTKTNFYTFKSPKPSISGTPPDRKQASDQERNPASALDRNRTSDNEYAVEEYAVEEYSDPSLRAAQAAHEGEKGKEEVRSEAIPQPTSTLTIVGDTQPQEAGQGEGVPGSVKTTPSSPSGQSAVTDLQRVLKAEERKLPEKKRGKYGGIFKEIICKGTTADELKEIIAYIVKRWPDEQLLPNEALAELRGERDAYVRGGTTRSSAPEVVEAIRGHDKLKRCANLAAEFDFAGEEEPQGRAWFGLGGTDRERGDNLARLRSVSKRAIREAQMSAVWPGSPPAATTLACELREEVSEGVYTPARRAIPNWTEIADRWVPVGASEEADRIAELLQNPNENAGRVMQRYLERRLAEENVIEAVSQSMWGQFEPPAECGSEVREAVEFLAGRAGIGAEESTTR